MRQISVIFDMLRSNSNKNNNNMKKRLPRKEKKYAKKQGGIYQYSYCLFCRHNIFAGCTSVTQPNGQEKYYYYKYGN